LQNNHLCAKLALSDGQAPNRVSTLSLIARLGGQATLANIIFSFRYMSFDIITATTTSYDSAGSFIGYQVMNIGIAPIEGIIAILIPIVILTIILLKMK